MVGKRAVRILLECFLVLFTCIHTRNKNDNVPSEFTLRIPHLLSIIQYYIVEFYSKITMLQIFQIPHFEMFGLRSEENLGALFVANILI